MCLLSAIYRKLSDCARVNQGRNSSFKSSHLGDLLWLATTCERGLLRNIHKIELPRKHDFIKQSAVLLGGSKFRPDVFPSADLFQ